MNELKDIRDFLLTCPPFSTLPAPLLERLCKATEISYHPEGSVILPFDQPNPALCLVRRGAVGVWTRDGEFVEKRAEGEAFGVPALITGRPTAFEVRAVEDALVYHFPEPVFRCVRAEAPDFDHHFSAAAIDRMQRAVVERPQIAQVRLKVRDLMSSPAISVPADTTIRVAAARMAEHEISSVLVRFPDGRFGIATDRDLRTRVVAAGRDIDGPIGDITTRDPTTISPTSTVMDALLLMTDRDVHHLPVTSSGELVGLISATDLFRADNDQPVFYVRNIRKMEDPESVARAARRRRELFVKLVRMEANSDQIGRLMTAITDAVTRRLLELAFADLGEPPVPWAWVCFGSEARREQTIRTDQDNGLILAETPDMEGRRYFETVTTRVCDGLNAAGFVHCPGGIMAKNPAWRLSVAGWRDRFAGWIDAPEPKPLMYASIFFDLRGVAGNLRLLEPLVQAIFEGTRQHRLFLRFMAQNALHASPPLGFFRRFILETDGQHSEGLNLKQRGVVPIISLARVRALEHGIAKANTLNRLAAVADRDTGAAGDLANLADAFELIERVRMESQAHQLEGGREPDNFADPDRLSTLSRDHLRGAFEVVRTAQNAMARRYMLG